MLNRLEREGLETNRIVDAPGHQQTSILRTPLASTKPPVGPMVLRVIGFTQISPQGLCSESRHTKQSRESRLDSRNSYYRIPALRGRQCTSAG
jgi:hypothetical protein